VPARLHSTTDTQISRRIDSALGDHVVTLNAEIDRTVRTLDACLDDVASCISCHAGSSIKNDGTDGITLPMSNPVGRPKPLPSSAWIRRDFVWSLSMACFNSPFQTCAAQ